MKDLTVSVSKAYSKQVTSTGEAGVKIISYVDKHWALRKGLVDKLNFKNVHPLDKDFVEITVPIKRF